MVFPLSSWVRRRSPFRATNWAEALPTGIWFLAISLLCFNPVSQAQESILLIGGGDRLTQSQISIERNSAWILAYLKSRKEGYPIQILYTDGNDPAPDVFQVIEPQSTLDRLKLLFGEDELHLYSNSHLADQVAPATAESVKRQLSQHLASQGATDGTTLIYQGHGDFSPQGTDNNYLRLWGESRLPALELSRILSENRGQTTIIRDDASGPEPRAPNNRGLSPIFRFRFLFTQCFSGSFARIIYREMDPKRGLTPDSRCGFVSQLEFLPSEGCTPSVNETGYRDYSTYFFEALNGVRRTGEPLPENPDFNGDAKVSLREAHLYTLRNAHSIDYSMATSEAYLFHWSKWYTRWLPAPLDRDNDYYWAAAKIAGGIGGGLLESRTERHALLARKRAEFHQMEQALTARQAEYQKQRSELAQALKNQWPWLPGHVKGTDAREAEFKAIQAQLDKQLTEGGFLELRTAIHRDLPRKTDLEREIAQIVKIDRMLELARLQTLFDRLASQRERAEYQRLLGCESSSL
ncbi:MAG: hypothetical protein KJ558_14425 [Gammaproteobacteria bacterium]|nr:hypothetical protein [Gammaproteobacteria bacterium]MBU1655985.1 hypothetical protein [Gammaproteobacteria bacterium]MBU1962569.1 hypothetical protein [Gammaproteobacteria bacterium]